MCTILRLFTERRIFFRTEKTSDNTKHISENARKTLKMSKRN